MISLLLMSALGQETTELRWARKVEPELPVALQGLPALDVTCVVRAAVDDRGRVTPMGVSGCSELLADAATSAAAKWRAVPASEDGRGPVAGAEIAFHFHLGSAPAGPGAGQALGPVAQVGAGLRLVNVRSLNFLDQPMPAWPEAVDREESPWCRLDLVLGEDGRIKATDARECHPGLAAAAEATAAGWRADPWYRGGKPEAARTTMWVRVGEPVGATTEAAAAGTALVWRRQVPVGWPRGLGGTYGETTCQAAVRTNERGFVVRVDVTGCDAAFARATVDAMLQWRAEPKVVDGQPVGELGSEAVVFTPPK